VDRACCSRDQWLPVENLKFGISNLKLKIPDNKSPSLTTNIRHNSPTTIHFSVGTAV